MTTAASDSTEADDPRYTVIVTRRLRWKGRLARPGDRLHLPSVASALHVITMGNGRPGDERTARSIELAQALRLAVPKA